MVRGGGGLAKRNLYFRSPWKTTTVLEKFKEVYLGMRGDIVLNKDDGGSSLEKDKGRCGARRKSKGSKLIELWVRDGEGPEVFILNGKSLIFARS